MAASTNPYRRPDAVSWGGSDGYWSRERERDLREAEGLTLSRLDRAVRESQLEAARNATLAAEAQAEQAIERIYAERFPQIYDEGYDAGVALATERCVAELMPSLLGLQRALGNVDGAARLGKSSRENLEDAQRRVVEIQERLSEVRDRV